MASKDENVSLEDEVRGRLGKSTPEYLQYKTELCVKRFKSAISTWLRQASGAMKLVTDSHEISELRLVRDGLEDKMTVLCNEQDKLIDYKCSDENLISKFEEIQSKHFDLIRCVSDKIRDLELEEQCKDNRSCVSSKHSSKLSSKSHQEKISASAEAAALRTKLKFIELENRKKTELERCQTEMKLSMAMAKIEAVDKLDSEELKLEQISHPELCADGKDQHLNDYISSVHLQVPTGNQNAPEPLPQDNNTNDNDQNYGEYRVPDSYAPSRELTNEYLVRSLSNQINIGRLPPPEPGTFAGNPLMYPKWRTAFGILIERRGIPEDEKIYYLQRYLGGPAKDAVEGFFLLSSVNAFRDAMNLLDKRFGNHFVIAGAFRDRLDSWPKIQSRDGKALRQLADFLRQCETAMSNMKSLQILNDEHENRKLIQKLPDWLINSWRRKVAECREQTSMYPKFSIFVSFISKEAEIMCDPVTSFTETKLSNKTQSVHVRSEPPTSRKYHSSVFNTSTKDQLSNCDKKSTAVFEACHFCKGKHKLDDCEALLSKSLTERKQFIIDGQLCFGCLKTGHRSRFCQNRLTCKTCSHLHATILHGDLPKPSEDTKPKSISHLSSEKGSVDKCSMILPVWISHSTNPAHELLTYALLDTQSDATFVLQSLSSKLGVSGPTVNLLISTMTSDKAQVTCEKIQGIHVRGMDTVKRITLPGIYTRDTIPANKDHIPTPQKIQAWPHLQQLNSILKPMLDVEIGLLIGYNCPQALVPREIIAPVRDNQPFGQKTDLGWGVVGIIDQTQIANSDMIGMSHNTISLEVPPNLQPPSEVHLSHRILVKEQFVPNDVVQMFSVDFNENDYSNSNISHNDRMFLKILEEGIHVTDGHYEMPLPFKHGTPTLSDNREMALQRLGGLKSKFCRNSRLHNDYSVFVNNMIRDGHAEEVPIEELDAVERWYIPHHGVYHPKKPTKIRVVFDCSSKYDGKCLNDCLLKGPDLTNNLLGLICRFRMEPVAIMCDVKQMFHQFFVNKEHRNFLRFLWWKNGDLDGQITEYRMKVHLFGAVSSPGCANFALKQTVIDHHSDISPETVEFIKNNFYVDDGLRSVRSAQEAVKLINESRRVCAMKGLHLHKFISNSKIVMSSIPIEDRVTEIQNIEIDCETLPTERVLGIQWCAEADCFMFQINFKGNEDKSVTRRTILSMVSSIFDPIGLLAPVILRGKLILQELCKDQYDWDSPVPCHIVKAWNSWKSDLQSLQDLRIARCVKPHDFGSVIEAQLHHFSDASVTGYGQCSYLRLVNEQRRVHCCLIMGKARVAPIKSVTVPRLELTAALTSVKVAHFLVNELSIGEVQNLYWTDSRIVLGYISNDSRRFHVYVANRVQQIRDKTTSEQWNHVNSQNNPADCASRGLSANKLQESLWFRGPDFLWESELHLTVKNVFDISFEDPEVKSTLFVTNINKNCFDLDRLNHISDWYRVKRAFTLCVRICNHFKKIDKDSNVKLLRKCSITELYESEISILKILQSKCFSEEISSIKNDICIKKKSVLYKLDPFINEKGLLCVGGRIQHATFDINKHPIILPKCHHITNLIVKYCHELSKHQGRSMTIYQLRTNGYWIIGCNSVISSHIWKCVTCRRLRGKLLKQKMSNLPEDRLKIEPMFTFCGMDCFGPFYVREGRKEIKRYGLIFVCLSSRAIHVEVLSDMSTDSFINGLRRFTAIRGPIQLLRCDNGTNFIGGQRELFELFKNLNEDEIHAYLLKNNCDYIKFKYNVPYASHMGGIWERQIQSVRKVLCTLLHQLGSQLDDDCLRTLMYECMAIVNSRPLSLTSLYDVNAKEPLCPNTLLTMKSNVILPPPSEFVKSDIYCRKRWKRVQYLTDQFWTRWRKEIVYDMQFRNKWNHSTRNLCVGDIVLIMDDHSSRNLWSLGIVENVYLGSDNLVRKVNLRVGDKYLDKNGKRKQRISYIDRPIHKLILLVETGYHSQGDI